MHTDHINPFTAPAGLKDACTHLQTVYFLVLLHFSFQCCMRFNENPFTCHETENEAAEGFPIWHFYWVFWSDITAVKGLIMKTIALSMIVLVAAVIIIAIVSCGGCSGLYDVGEGSRSGVVFCNGLQFVITCYWQAEGYRWKLGDLDQRPYLLTFIEGLFCIYYSYA